MISFVASSLAVPSILLRTHESWELVALFYNATARKERQDLQALLASVQVDRVTDLQNGTISDVQKECHGFFHFCVHDN